MSALVEITPDAGGRYRLLRISSERFGVGPSMLSREQEQEANEIARRELFMERTILNRPEARQVAVPPSQVQEALQQIKSRYESESEFSDALVASDLDEASLMLAIERELRVEAVLSLVSSSAEPVSETEARLYYYLHPEKFQKPETRVVRHILITINNDFSDNSEQAAEERINQIQRRLIKSPHRFEQQALQFSECPTALQGGLIGEVKQGALYPELDEVLFNMKAGQISGVVRSSIGFHVVKCEQVNPAVTAPLSEVLSTLLDKLTQRQQMLIQKRWIKQILSEPVDHDLQNTEMQSWQKQRG